MAWPHSVPFKFTGKISKVTIELKPTAIAIEADKPIGKSVGSGTGGLTVRRVVLNMSAPHLVAGTYIRRGLYHVFPSDLFRTSERVASAVHN